MTVRFGMIGTGAMAVAMLPAFRHAEGTDLIAVSSAQLERAEAFAAKHGIKKAYGSLGALLDDPEIDAVYVANRTGDHVETSIAALQSGKHVLCEKPFAMNAEEGARVLEAARNSGKLFMDALWTLFLPAYQRAYDGIANNEIGAASQLIAGYGYPISPAASPRLYDRHDGGVLLDIGVYPIALALRMFGDIDHIKASVQRNADKIDTHLSLQMQHRNGATSDLVASIDMLASNAAYIGGSKGQIRIPAPLFGAEELVIEPLRENGSKDFENPANWTSKLKQNPILRRLKRVILRKGERHPYGVNQYLPQMTHFVNAIVAGKTQSDIVTHDLSLNVLRILDQIRSGEGK